MKKIILIIMILTSSIVFMACGNQQEKIVIASKPMTEQYIIVEMLTYLIEDNTDLEVEQKLGIGGGTSNIHPGMVSGSIDMYPEYTGTGWLFVLEEDLITDPDLLYQAVKDSYETEYGIVWTELYGFNNTFGLAMKETLAQSLNISTYSELAAQSEDLILGAEYDFYERDDGYPGLEETYGFNFDSTTELDIGLKYQAISTDAVDVINIFSTDGRLEEFGLRVLEDDLNFFPSYFAATLVREEILEMYPELIDVLAMLEGQISNEEMTRMNYLVDIENEDPQDVAREYLEEKGLR